MQGSHREQGDKAEDSLTKPRSSQSWVEQGNWANLAGKATAGPVWCHPPPEPSHRVAEHQPRAWLFQTCKCSNLKLPFF